MIETKLFFPVNRPLTKEEGDLRLDPNERLNVDPRTQLSVIRINSTFLECVDFFYSWRGVAALSGLVIIIAFSWALLAILTNSISNWSSYSYHSKQGAIIAGSIILVISLIAIGIGYVLLRFDAFKLTHFPIRLNRKNRMVYVMRRDNTVMSVRWDDLFVTQFHNPNLSNYQLRAYVLKEDGLTVKEAFAFCNPSGTQLSCKELWEYMRRYMEEGPQEPYNYANYCLPLWDRKESVKFSFIRLMANYAGHPIGQFLMSPLILLFTIGRTFTMRTCKIPQWPDEVEAACTIEPGDPCVKDWRSNPTSVDFS